MKADAWQCDTCQDVRMLAPNATAKDGWFELVRHFDDGFAMATQVRHYCSAQCLARSTRMSDAIATGVAEAVSR